MQPCLSLWRAQITSIPKQVTDMAHAAGVKPLQPLTPRILRCLVTGAEYECPGPPTPAGGGEAFWCADG